MAANGTTQKRLASLIADERGVCDCTNFTTYASGHIPRDPVFGGGFDD